MTFARASIMGFLGKDPVFKTTPSGKQTADISIATSEIYKDRNGEMKTSTHWHRIFITSQNLIPICEKILKGDSVFFHNLSIGEVSFTKLGTEETVRYTQFKGDSRSMIQIIKTSAERFEENSFKPKDKEEQKLDEGDEVPF